MTGTITKAELRNLSLDEALKSADGVRGLLDALEGASCRPGTVIGPERALYLKGYFSSGEGDIGFSLLTSDHNSASKYNLIRSINSLHPASYF